MSDFGQMLNDRIQDLPARGGVIAAHPGSTSTTIKVDRPCTIVFGYGTYEFTGVGDLFQISSSEVHLAGVGHGGRGTTLLYQGTKPVRLIHALGIGYLEVSRMCLKFAGEDSHAAGILLDDPVGFDLSNIFVSHGPGGNSVSGIRVVVSKPNLVPQRGFGRIVNYLYTGESTVLPGSVAIDLQGVPGGAITNVSIEGYANIEQCEVGLRTTCTSQILWSGPCFFQGCGTGILCGPYSSMGFSNAPRFNECPVVISVAPGCEDNVFLNPGWATFGMGAVQNAGVRTILLAGPRGAWNLASVPLLTRASVTAGNFELVK